MDGTNPKGRRPFVAQGNGGRRFHSKGYGERPSVLVQYGIKSSSVAPTSESAPTTTSLDQDTQDSSDGAD